MIVRFAQEKDMKDICSLLISDEELVSDDLTAELNEDTLIRGLSNHTVVVVIDTQIQPEIVCAMFLLVGLNSTLSEIHTCIHKDYRGKQALMISTMVKDFIFRNTPLIRIIAHIPTYNFPVYVLAKKMGMELIGIDKKSIVKNKKVYDQYIFGISKEDI
jgi:RimJ/RimL family protein N-acetyltransferase